MTPSAVSSGLPTTYTPPVNSDTPTSYYTPEEIPTPPPSGWTEVEKKMGLRKQHLQELSAWDSTPMRSSKYRPPQEEPTRKEESNPSPSLSPSRGNQRNCCIIV